jgi:hypothetical protein
LLAAPTTIATSVLQVNSADAATIKLAQYTPRKVTPRYFHKKHHYRKHHYRRTHH